MPSLNQKIHFLKSILEKEEENYADSFKADIVMYFDDDFTESNQSLSFLNKLNSFEEIENWVDSLTSKFVMKFDEELEQENDFIEYYINGQIEPKDSYSGFRNSAKPISVSLTELMRVVYK